MTRSMKWSIVSAMKHAMAAESCLKDGNLESAQTHLDVAKRKFLSLVERDVGQKVLRKLREQIGGWIMVLERMEKDNEKTFEQACEQADRFFMGTIEGEMEILLDRLGSPTEFLAKKFAQ